MVFCDINFSASDWVAIIGIIISIFLGTIVVNSQTKKRAQKEFFIKEIDNLKQDYNTFIRNLRGQNLSSEAIRDGFKIFSDRIRMLDEFITNEYIIKNNVFNHHGKLQVCVTELRSIEEQYQNSRVTFTEEEITLIDKNYNYLNKSFIQLIVDLNKASVIKPWDQEDFYNI